MLWDQRVVGSNPISPTINPIVSDTSAECYAEQTRNERKSSDSIGNNSSGIVPDEKPLSLRKRIMERRRNRYGLGPIQPKEASYEQWLAGLPKAEAAVWTPPAPRPAPHLYFIRSQMGPIKIGVSSDPEQRLKGLQTSHPAPLEIVAVVENAGAKEPEYHRLFDEHRLMGEWFNPAPEILAEIDRINSEQAA